jgi:hypothetical protein
MFHEKRASRFRLPRQIRAGEQMVRAIQRDADVGDRPFNRQLLHYVKLGIKHARECEEKSQGVPPGHREKRRVTKKHGGKL